MKNYLIIVGLILEDSAEIFFKPESIARYYFFFKRDKA